ncbi:MAG TPA: CAP domain-containing protein [Thermohalobaculum sp.]|nr:CAP domain-containing protein [Thermohalobaculum sp.]
MTPQNSAAGGRTRKIRLPMIVAGAALVLGGCVVPVPVSLGSGERSGSMLASDASCPAGSGLGARFEQPVDPASVDPGLLTEALRHLVNGARCERGATPLALSPAAVQAAHGHARSMAKHDFMGHASPIRGRETLPQRIKAESGRFGHAAENVARAATTMLDADGCLGPAGTGGSMPTYGNVARGLFNMWITSAKHSANMLNPSYRQVGAGLGVNPGKYRCGEIAATMVFIG